MILPLDCSLDAIAARDGWLVWTAELMISVRAIDLSCGRCVHSLQIGSIPLMSIDAEGIELAETIRLTVEAKAGMIVRLETEAGDGDRPFLVLTPQRAARALPRGRRARVVVIR